MKKYDDTLHNAAATTHKSRHQKANYYYYYTSHIPFSLVCMQWYLFPEKTTGWCPDFFQTQVLFFDPIDMEGLWSKKRSAGTLISMYGSPMHFQILRSITCCYNALCRVVVDMGGDSDWLRLDICFFSNRAHSYAHWNLFRSTLLALLHMFHPARDNCLQMKGMTAKHNVTPEIICNH